MNEKEINNLCDHLIGSLADAQPKKFKMSWRGSKIPRGGKIGKIEIVWTQHGIIRGINSEELGYYERAKEFCGDTHDEHEMIVSAEEQAYNPDGSPCEAI